METVVETSESQSLSGVGQRALEAMSPLNEAFKKWATSRLKDDFEIASRVCESPIEVLLLATYLTMSQATRFESAGRRRRVQIACVSPPVINSLGEFCGITDTVFPQLHLGDYRVDFAFSRSCIDREHDDGDPFVIVECDGHDFHERTKEQAARDKSRDRELQLAGHRVLRFTGSEIWRDPVGCAHQIDECLG
jgi:very-short-patch-repair endonuclease